MPTAPLSRAFLWLTIAVCLASALVSGFFGNLAGYYDSYHFGGPDDQPYLDPPWLIPCGIGLGVVAGIGAGLLWSLWMRRLTLRAVADRGRPGAVLISQGLGLGVAVGLIATIVLHLGLIILMQGTARPGYIKGLDGLLFGLVFGAPAGAGLGFIAGLAWWLVVRKFANDAAATAPPASETAP